jgi:hypothetical protein
MTGEAITKRRLNENAAKSRHSRQNAGKSLSACRLKKQVFQSILGYYWYLRLRGHEIDAVDFQRKSFGNTYALQKQTNDPREQARLLMKLCEKTGRRLRRAKYSAQGVHVACVYTRLWPFRNRPFGDQARPGRCRAEIR